MAKIENIVTKTKIAVKKSANWIKSNEGQVTIFAAFMGMCLGAFLANKQDAKAMGLTYGQLMAKIREAK